MGNYHFHIVVTVSGSCKCKIQLFATYVLKSSIKGIDGGEWGGVAKPVCAAPFIFLFLALFMVISQSA